MGATCRKSHASDRPAKRARFGRKTFGSTALVSADGAASFRPAGCHVKQPICERTAYREKEYGMLAKLDLVADADEAEALAAWLGLELGGNDQAILIAIMRSQPLSLIGP